MGAIDVGAEAEVEVEVVPGSIEEAVVRAGTELVLAHGLVKGLSMMSHTRLARMAHCGTNSLYRRWGTREELAEFVMLGALLRRPDDLTEILESTIRTSLAARESLGVLIRRSCAACVQVYGRGTVFEMTIVADRANLPESVRVTCERRILHLEAQSAKLADFMAAVFGLVPLVPDAARLYAMAAMAGTAGIVNRLSLDDSPGRELSTELLTTICLGVLSRTFGSPDGRPIESLHPLA
jgi:AcrR family transcriptional regulator